MATGGRGQGAAGALGLPRPGARRHLGLVRRGRAPPALLGRSRTVLMPSSWCQPRSAERELPGCRSGGGSSTLQALFRFPDVYKAGASVAFIADQRFYDTIYQARSRRR